jgi:hypothetical protein
MLRHFVVALGALTYLGAVPLFLYQYLGTVYGWPGVFLAVLPAQESWRMDIQWHSPVVWGFVATVCAAAVIYAIIRRHDSTSYREPTATSQPGF